MKYGTYRFKDSDKHKALKKKLIDDDISFQKFVSQCIDKYLEGKIRIKPGEKD
jgi:hypothetical protein